MEKTEKCYQWKKGDDYGNCDKVQSEKKIGEDTFIVFESGRLINKKLIEEFLVEIPSLNEPFFSQEDVNNEIDAKNKITKQPVTKAPQRKTAVENYDYPSEEELANHLKDGKYSMGNAKAIPHPDDMPPPRIEKSKDNFTTGLVEEGKEHLQRNNDFAKGLTEETRPTRKPENPFASIIDKARKKDFTLNLKINVKLPSEAFFEILDEDFVNENIDSMLNALINKIKQSDLDSQIKENLIQIYKLDTLCQTKNITTDENEST